MKNLFAIATALLTVTSSAHAQQVLHSIKTVAICAAPYQAVRGPSTGTSFDQVDASNSNGYDTYVDQAKKDATAALYQDIGSQDQNPNFWASAQDLQAQDKLCHTYSTNADQDGNYATNYKCSVSYYSAGGNLLYNEGDTTDFANAVRTLYESCRYQDGNFNNSLCMNAAFVTQQINCQKQ